MNFIASRLAGVFIIEPKVFTDERGFFMESYNKQLFAENGIDVEFVQDNHSRSSKGVLRGLHFQTDPMAQDKLVRVTSGEVFDVVVDLRKSSATYGDWMGINLSAENKKMLFVPRGFAHGFAVISDVVDFEYKVSNYYSREHEGGIIWNDPTINIAWPLKDPIISEKDSQQVEFAGFGTPFK